MQIDSLSLLEGIKAHFDLSELHDLCFRLNIDSENLRGETKADKTRELMEFCRRRGRMTALVRHLMELRPQNDWLDLVLNNAYERDEIQKMAITDNQQMQITSLALLEERDQHIFVFNKDRSQITKLYTEIATGADRLDIIALTMQTVLDNYGDERLFDWILKGTKVRILVLSPMSMAAELRSKQEGIDLSLKTMTQIARLKNCVYHEVAKQVALEKRCLGALEVRLYDGLPYFAYFNADERMIVGLDYSHIKGLQSEAFYIGVGSPVHKKMRGHFEAMWKGQNESTPLQQRVICKITELDQHFTDLDRLNKDPG